MPPNHMHSLSEAKVNSYLQDKDQRADWRAYNRSHMTRVYPGGGRVDSSNDNPISSWSVGSQLVALNFQKPDSDTRLNHGRFRENGGCGYVPKPRSINTADASALQSLIVHVKVLCGSCLPKPKGKKTGERID